MNRGTLFVEDAIVQRVDSMPGDQFVVRLRAPRTARAATPGSFVHLQCDPAIPMRRPLSIMRAGDDWIDVLFKIVGEGLRALGERDAGDAVSIIGPVGNGFSPSPSRRNALLIGGGVGIPPMVFLAETMRTTHPQHRPLVIMGSEIPFPFERRQSAIETPWLDAEIDATMPLLEQWGVPARLASLSGFEGTYRGYVTDLAVQWLDTLDAGQLGDTEVFACGPTPMLEAVAAMARRYGLSCQVSLEEFMACAVGGCAGCTVLVRTGAGPAMKRVCVDGPVFDAAAVFGD